MKSVRINIGYKHVYIQIHIRVRIHSHKQGKIGFECINFETYMMYFFSSTLDIQFTKDGGEKEILINAWVKNLIEKEEEHKWTQEAQWAGNIVV